MINHDVAIYNLLFKYAELIDSGDLVHAAELFRNAEIKTQLYEHLIGEKELLATWQRLIKMYPCGTPRTRHIVTNVILDIDDSLCTAFSKSYYTVYQLTDQLPLQLIASGRYHDKFYFSGGEWNFSYRDYSLLDMVGDLSGHLTEEVS